jgi:hypothetical protein
MLSSGITENQTKATIGTTSREPDRRTERPAGQALVALSADLGVAEADGRRDAGHPAAARTSTARTVDGHQRRPPCAVATPSEVSTRAISP